MSTAENPIDLEEVVVNPRRREPLLNKPFDLNEVVTLPTVKITPDDSSSKMIKTLAIGAGALIVASFVLFGLKKKK